MNEQTPMNQKDLLFVDVETSGLDPSVHEILELAAVRTTHDLRREVGVVHLKTRMTRPAAAAPEALSVNGYDERAWADAVPIRLALLEFSKLLGADYEIVWVGHNPHFDKGFIDAAARAESIVLPRTKYLVDTMSIAWPLCVRGMLERVNLESLCSRYNISNAGAHGALPDVRRTMAVYRKLLGLRPTQEASATP
jgi:DNA polymerase III epsilon subunit-like protein